MGKPRFTPIEGKVLEQFLAEKGFHRAVSGSEIVYVREHSYSKAIKIKVWTSIKVGETTVRGSGRDAIRVTVAYENMHPMRPHYNREASKSFGIYKTTRVFRTGGEEAIFERLYERMREAYQFATDWIRDHWKDLGNVGAANPPSQNQAPPPQRSAVPTRTQGRK